MFNLQMTLPMSPYKTLLLKMVMWHQKIWLLTITIRPLIAWTQPLISRIRLLTTKTKLLITRTKLLISKIKPQIPKTKPPNQSTRLAIQQMIQLMRHQLELILQFLLKEYLLIAVSEIQHPLTSLMKLHPMIQMDQHLVIALNILKMTVIWPQGLFQLILMVPYLFLITRLLLLMSKFVHPNVWMLLINLAVMLTPWPTLIPFLATFSPTLTISLPMSLYSKIKLTNYLRHLSNQATRPTWPNFKYLNPKIAKYWVDLVTHRKFYIWLIRLHNFKML